MATTVQFKKIEVPIVHERGNYNYHKSIFEIVEKPLTGSFDQNYFLDENKSRFRHYFLRISLLSQEDYIKQKISSRWTCSNIDNFEKLCTLEASTYCHELASLDRKGDLIFAKVFEGNQNFDLLVSNIRFIEEIYRVSDTIELIYDDSTQWLLINFKDFWESVAANMLFFKILRFTTAGFDIRKEFDNFLNDKKPDIEVQYKNIYEYSDFFEKLDMIFGMLLLKESFKSSYYLYRYLDNFCDREFFRKVKEKKQSIKNKKVEMEIKNYKNRIRVLSRHPSHNALREMNLPAKYTTVVRFGSQTESKAKIQINSIESVRNSSSKILMKQCFEKDGVKTAPYIFPKNKEDVLNFTRKFEKSQFVTKSQFGSRGLGNKIWKENEIEKMIEFLESKEYAGYIVEKYMNYSREYRLHITEDGCFYTCRKMLKNETPEELRWFRNDSNSVWIREENESFQKPVFFDSIIQESVKALKSVGLDIGAVDVRVSKNDFVIIEINSAPSFGEITLEKYADILPKIVAKKASVCVD